MKNWSTLQKNAAIVAGSIVVGGWLLWSSGGESRDSARRINATTEKMRQIDKKDPKLSQDASPIENPYLVDNGRVNKEFAELSPSEVESMICLTEGAGKSPFDPYYKECQDAGY